MTISIQLQSTDDPKVLETLLKMLDQFEVKVHVVPGPSGTGKKSARKGRGDKKIAARLHGIIQLPKDFNYKSELEKELFNKYGLHG